MTWVASKRLEREMDIDMVDKMKIYEDQSSSLKIVSPDGIVSPDVYFLVVRCSGDKNGGKIMVKANEISIDEVIDATIYGACMLGQTMENLLNKLGMAVSKYYIDLETDGD